MSVMQILILDFIFGYAFYSLFLAIRRSRKTLAELKEESRSLQKEGERLDRERERLERELEELDLEAQPDILIHTYRERKR